MKFKRVFRGYDPKEVDKHLTEFSYKEQQIRAAQKERIDELLEENRALRQSVAQYKADEQAISRALVEVEQLASRVKREADRYSESVVQRAKIFCAGWQAYSRTLVAALSDDEVRQLNCIQRQIENLIAVYTGEQAKEVAATNPIDRVKDAAEQVIDLDELAAPTQSLEEICLELGIIKK